MTSVTQFKDSFSEEIWESTYKYHEDNNVDDTFKRVAKAIASVEKTEKLKLEWEEKFFDMLTNFKITTGGRIYANAGTEFNGTSLINCFVGPRDTHDIDSIDGILKHLLWQTKTLKSEGGWGENFSYIRPRGSFIHGIGVESPGAVKYMEMFDKSSDIITAGSGRKSTNKKAKKKIRKGAMMGGISDWHPDVIEFITAKQQPGRLQKFNVSVGISDEFMQKLDMIFKLREENLQHEKNNDIEAIEKNNILIEENKKWDLYFPDTTFEKYKEEWDGNIKLWKSKGYPIVIYNTVDVEWLWNLITESTYNRAEPGLLFLDRANEYNPLYYKENIEISNPCGEQLLSPGNICCLSSLNLTQFINDDLSDFDYDKIKKYTRYLVRFLDNVNSYSVAPLDNYKFNMENKRRIGCGILGWGSSLFIMKVKFASEKAQEIQEKLMSTFARECYMASIDLAEEKGMFSLCEPEKHVVGKFVNQLGLPEEYLNKMRIFGIRNSSLLSIQPNGNSSIFANLVSGGCEPIFMPEYIRTTIVNAMPEHIKNITPKWYEGEWFETEMFKSYKEGDDDMLRGVDEFGVVYKIDKNRGLTKEVLCEDYGVKFLKERGEWNPSADWAVTTTNLTVDEHVRDLKGFARWIDSSISKTINVPFEYSFEDFKKVYFDAWKTGYIKGITTYRSGTMMSVLSAKAESGNGYEEIIQESVKMPDSQQAILKTIRSEGRKWYLTITMDEFNVQPIALFVHTNHPEKNATTHDAVEKLIQLAVDKKIPQHWIDETIKKMETDNNTTKIAKAIGLNLRHGVHIKNVVLKLNEVDTTVNTFLFQIRKFLSQFIKDGEKVENSVCESCGSNNIVFSEGCQKCMSCGSSKCG